MRQCFGRHALLRVVGYGMSFLLPDLTIEGRHSDGFDAAFAPRKCNSRVFSESATEDGMIRLRIRADALSLFVRGAIRKY